MFQPILYLADDTVSHYEALARMRSDGGCLDAAHFISHAERLGLVGEIDVLMLREVMRTLSAHPELVIASNLSGYSLNNRHLQNRLFEILDRHRDVAPRLILEITESTAIAEIDDAKSFIHRAKENGCRFAIDDFGVGYSSLQSLSQLDVDYLKIDGSLLKTLHSENTALLMAVQGLADALNIPTVAEHVDSEEKLEVIRRIGIRYAQGYLIGRAAPLSEFMVRQ
jgi:EAL domain-containing protein (putative c-di-GMP-specific phosphodiesterase class I)